MSAQYSIQAGAENTQLVFKNGKLIGILENIRYGWKVIFFPLNVVLGIVETPNKSLIYFDNADKLTALKLKLLDEAELI